MRELLNIKNLGIVGGTIAFLLLLNVLADFFPKRIDLTKEGRYSLTDSTKDLLSQIDEPITFKIYLEGEFPAGLKRLQEATRDMLDEFRAYAGSNIQYDFIDPLEDIPEEEKDRVKRQLVEEGVKVQRLIEQDGGYSEKEFFPSAQSIYRGRKLPVQLLEEQLGMPPLEVINNSIALLEYKLANVIQKAVLQGRQKIAFLEGHGELPEQEVADLAMNLGPYYEMIRFNMEGRDAIPVKYDLLVIAKPRKAFTELEKFKIDQYVLKGGKIIWMVEGLNAEIDSLRNKAGSFIPEPQELNLEDMLFAYGVRVNDNLIQDKFCTPIPIPTSFDDAGNATNMKLFEWIYFPLLGNMNQDHPITKNMGPITSQFASSIDTVGAKGIKKTILLQSSNYTKLPFYPAPVSLNIIRQKIADERFNKGPQPVAVALEGKFPSVFKNRLAATTIAKLDTLEGITKAEESKPTKMIVISDGDIMRNDFNPQNGQPVPLGYNQFTKQTFANKSFLLNCIEWLLDDAGIISSRSKELKLRLLNEELIESEETYWQFFNLLLPLLFLVIGGVGFVFWRRRKYASPIG